MWWFIALAAALPIATAIGTAVANEIDKSKEWQQRESFFSQFKGL